MGITGDNGGADRKQTLKGITHLCRFDMQHRVDRARYIRLPYVCFVRYLLGRRFCSHLRGRVKLILHALEVLAQIGVALGGVAVLPWRSTSKNNRLVVLLNNWAASVRDAIRIDLGRCFDRRTDAVVGLECAGARLDIQVDLDSTVLELKKHLREALQLSDNGDEIELECRGRRMDIGWYTLNDYGVRESSSICRTLGAETEVGHCTKAKTDLSFEYTFRPKEIRSCLIRIGAGSFHHYVFTASVLVQDLRDHVARIINTSKSDILLTYGGKALGAVDQTLFDYGVYNGAIISVGLALVGGSESS